MNEGDVFRLANEKRSTPQRFATSDRTCQKLLFSGLDCLPGQLDLFQTDGELTEGDSDESHSHGKRNVHD
jgi:hypothetical protein